MGVILALKLLLKEKGINTVAVLLDNQAVIQTLSYIKIMASPTYTQLHT